MSLEWKTYKIGDVVSVRRGASPRPIKDYISEAGVPWVKIADATSDQTRFISSTKEFIIEDGVKSSVTVYPGDLIVSNSATPGLPKFMKIKACVHDGWLVFDEYDGILKEYLYYYFIVVRDRLVNQANGSVFKNLKTDIVRDFDINLPSLETQEKIIKILSSIDEKIEKNIAINKNLDKTIRTLYNSWFVNFLPFQNQEFEDTYMGKIPKNWVIKNLNEVCDKISESYKPDSEEVVLIQTSDVSKGKVLNHEKVPNDNYKGHFKYKFEKNDILYTQIRPKNERYAFINFNPINYVASTQLMVLRAKPNIILPYILYLFLTSRDMIMEVNLLAESRSGTFPQINFNEIKYEKVIVAPFEVYEKFWNLIESLVEKKFSIDDEIIKLTQLRDTLLPKLMSGEIDVSKINCDL